MTPTGEGQGRAKYRVWEPEEFDEGDGREFDEPSIWSAVERFLEYCDCESYPSFETSSGVDLLVRDLEGDGLFRVNVTGETDFVFHQGHPQYVEEPTS